MTVSVLQCLAMICKDLYTHTFVQSKTQIQGIYTLNNFTIKTCVIPPLRTKYNCGLSINDHTYKLTFDRKEYIDTRYIYSGLQWMKLGAWILT